jgi:hypothetical protein
MTVPKLDLVSQVDTPLYLFFIAPPKSPLSGDASKYPKGNSVIMRLTSSLLVEDCKYIWKTERYIILNSFRSNLPDFFVMPEEDKNAILPNVPVFPSFIPTDIRRVYSIELMESFRSNFRHKTMGGNLELRTIRRGIRKYASSDC